MDRAAVARWLGEPVEQEGSVNDPRTTLEFGVRWNEKWIYPPERPGGWTRVALFHRYDLVGVFRVAASGAHASLPLPERP